MKRRFWTASELETLRRMYPDNAAWEVAKALNCSEARVYNKASQLGLHKSAEYLASAKSGRMRPGHNRGGATRFGKGHEPWNKGTHFVAGGRSAETRFKKGEMHGAAQHNYKPIGSLRISKDGYLERKVTDDHPVPARRWVAVHRLVWEAANGPIPKGHAVVFLPGQRTNVEKEITVDRLECISRSELMKRNTVHNLPKEITQVIQLKGAVQRQINKRTGREKQNRRSA